MRKLASPFILLGLSVVLMGAGVAASVPGTGAGPQIFTDSGLTLMGSDTPNRMEYTAGNNYSVSLSGEDEAELRGFWDGLTAGGIVSMPLERAPWGDFFGMCSDKFGVSWLISWPSNQYLPELG